MEQAVNPAYGFLSILPSGCSGISGNDGYGRSYNSRGYARTYHIGQHDLPWLMYDKATMHLKSAL